MAESRHTAHPAVITAMKRDSYLRHVRIHMELLHDSLTGKHFGCGVGERDREEIDKRLLEIWSIAAAAKLEHVEVAPSADATPPASAKILPFRLRFVG